MKEPLYSYKMSLFIPGSIFCSIESYGIQAPCQMTNTIALRSPSFPSISTLDEVHISKITEIGLSTPQA